MQRDSGAPLWEFFAGGGLARLGLEPDFACVFANDLDPSKAGARRGLAAPRSGAFWGFHALIEKLGHEGRAPDVLALENVSGLLSSHGGADFAGRLQAAGFNAWHVTQRVQTRMF